MSHRENSPDFSHPLRVVDEEDRVQQMRLLEVPGNGSRISRQSSVASSLTDLAAPIYARNRRIPEQIHNNRGNNRLSSASGDNTRGNHVKNSSHASYYLSIVGEFGLYISVTVVLCLNSLTSSRKVFIKAMDTENLGKQQNGVMEEETQDKASVENEATHANAAAKLMKDPDGAGQKSGFNGRLAFAITAAAFGSAFQHGYNTGVVNAPQELIEKWIEGVVKERTGEIPEQATVTMIFSLAVSLFCVGGMLGGCITGYVADKFGRKGGLLVNNVLVFAAALMMGAAKSADSYEMLILGRFLIGVNSGLNAGLAPMYLAEIAPVHLRGAVGTVYQLVITISILMAQLLGLGSVMGTPGMWPMLLALTALPAIFQLATLPICPESPKYTLLNCGKELEAQRGLTWLRGTIEVHDEMEEMRSEYEAAKLVSKVNMKELFVNSTLRSPLIICLVIMIAQQLSGINAVMFFSTKIFKMAQLTDDHAQLATIAVGTMNVIMTLISLVLVEKAGRKTLLLVGFGGMVIDTFLLAICLKYATESVWISYFSIVLVIFFVIMFATGPGSIPWFLVSELFNQSARPAATSLAVCVNWTANFIVGIGFLPLQEAIGGNVFFVFSFLLVIFVLFVLKKVPETKNKTMEEISSMFRQQSYQ